MRYVGLFIFGLIGGAFLCYMWTNDYNDNERLVLQTNTIVQYRTAPVVIRWATNKQFYTNNITNYIVTLEKEIDGYETNAGWIKVVKDYIHAGLYKRAWMIKYSIEGAKKNSIQVTAGQAFGVAYLRDILGIQAGASILFVDGKTLFALTAGYKF